MLTTLDSSPTCSSTTSVFIQPTSCTSPAPDTRTEQPYSPSKQQDLSCAKHPSSRMRHSSRHTPYPDGTARSPGSCSSDGGDSVQSDGDNVNPDGTRVTSKVKRIAANSRERKRMHTVNSAFDQLRELVPTYPSNRKLSKIDTLRLACTYIQDLVSILQHNHAQAIQGDDVLYNQPPPFPDSFSGYPVSVKPEPLGDGYTAFEHFRMPQALRFPTDACAESYPSSASESDSTTHSPPHPHQFMPQQVPTPQPPPVIPTSSSASLQCNRPPPLTRVNSEGTASIHTRLAEASISGGPVATSSQPQVLSVSTTCTPLTLPPPPPPAAAPAQTSMYQQRQVQITSPLAMHSVHHHHSPQTPTLIQNTLGHHSPPPVWQRPAAVPNYAHALYGQ